MLRIWVTGAAIIAAMPAAAQDISSPYDGAVAEHGQRQLMDTLARRRLQQAQQRQAQQRQPRANAQTTAANARALCRNREAVAARLPAAKARQFRALCAQAGY